MTSGLTPNPIKNVTATATYQILPPDIAVSPTALNFGNVEIGQTKDLFVTVSNPGSATLNVSFIHISGDSIYYNYTNPDEQSFTVAPGGSHQVGVRFMPFHQNAVGTHQATLVLNHNVPNKSPVSISLTGTGVIPSPTLEITTSSLVDGTVNAFYHQFLRAEGGTTPYTWSVQSGTLPIGLNFDSSNDLGILSGTPTEAGTWNFTVQVQDSGSQTASRGFTLVINPPPDTTPPPAPPNLHSSTHLVNTPSRNNNPVFLWDEPFDASGIAGYSYHLDQSPASIPDAILDDNLPTAAFVGLADAAWYFHLRAQDNVGNWGDAAHYGPIVVVKHEVIELKNVYHVPSQRASIRDAITAAQVLGGPAAVVVHAGTYLESVWLDPGILLVGEGADVVTIQAPNSDEVAVVAAEASLIAGFTLTGSVVGIDAAIRPGITDFQVLNNRIANNTVGVYLNNASLTLIGNEISGNGGEAVSCTESSHPLIANNRIFANQGGSAIACQTASSPIIMNNAIEGNGLLGIAASDNSMPLVMNNIIANHGDLNLLGNTGGRPLVSYNLIYPSQYTGVALGQGNLFEQEPLFVDAANHDYHLQLASPAIDAGDPRSLSNDNPQTQQGGVRNDMGAYGGPYGVYPVIPIADFSAPQTSGTLPFAVQFQNDSFGAVDSYLWEFGDGQTSVEPSPTHTYTDAGDYTVKLTVTGPGGATRRVRQNYLHITDPATPIPDAEFTATPLNGAAPLQVQFTDTSTNNPTSWYWLFGDLTWSFEQNPVHIYPSAGTYTVSLTVSNAGGQDSETKTDYIVVESTFPPGEITQFGPHIKVNTVSDRGETPQLKVDQSGTIYVSFWVSGQNAVMLTKSTDGGASFLPESPVNSQPARQGDLSMDLDSNGNVYLAWFDYNDNLWLSKSSDGGENFSHQIAFNWDGGGQPTLVVNENDEVCLLWNAPPDLFFSKSVDGGNTFNPPVLVTNTPDQKDNPTMAVRGAHVYVVWIAPYSTGDLHLARSTNGGVSFDAPVRVNRTPGQVTWGHAVAASPSGAVYVAYLDTQADSEGDVYLARSLDGGQSFSSHTLVTDSTLRNQYLPQLVVDGSGKIYVTWGDYRSNDTYFLEDIYYSESTDEGLTFSANVDVTPVQSSQNAPVIDVDSNGEVYLAWVDKRDGGNPHVYFTSSSSPQVTVPAAPSNLTAVAASDTQIDLSWQDNATNEDGFSVERKPAGGNFQQIATLPADQTSYEDTGLETETTYVYRLQAYNSVGVSVYSNEASATTLTTTPNIEVTPQVLDYGAVFVGDVKMVDLTLKNIGNADLVVSGLDWSGSSDFAAAPVSTPFTLAPGASQTITVTYQPTASGAAQGTLTITHNAGSGSTTVTGNGIGSCFFADLTCDGVVDISDLTAIAQRWNSKAGDVNYDAQYDLDNNGEIDIFDVQLIADAFGQQPPFATPSLLFASASVQMSLNGVPSKLQLGHRATATLAFEPPISFQAVEIHFAYDPDRLSLQEISRALLAKPDGLLELGPHIDKEQGTIVFGAIRSMGSDDSDSPPASELASLEFLAEQVGAVDLELTRVKLISTNGARVPVTVEGPARLQVVPPPPQHSSLFPNFPNPFNPETWIPFQLASDSDVVIQIYDIRGTLVRRLNLGYTEAGYYLDKRSAAYWDGRSQTGEQVASGIYFYTIGAGSFLSTRRMVIVK